MAINIPINTGGVFVSASSTVIGSFGGMLVLAGGSTASISSLKYISGYTVSNPGFNPTYSIAEATLSNFSIANGTKLELAITTCSLAAGSSPVLLYN